LTPFLKSHPWLPTTSNSENFLPSPESAKSG